jgi:thiol-disulfide isomerase/thioredoxin
VSADRLHGGKRSSHFIYFRLRCGPCKVLGPALEEMAIKSGGAFRLVKVNSDNERPVSTSLEVKALPSVFGLKDGKILNMFQGMPESESAMKNFMMGLLLPGNKFDPPLTEADNKKFEELSKKLVKMAGAACLSFSARERLNDRISASLGDLVTQTGNVLDADKSATILRSLLSNAIQDPYNSKFRRINLANAVVASKVAEYPACVTILKSVGFVRNTEGSEMVLGKGKKVVNVAPLVVARDSIDKWVDQKRYEVAAAARKRKDEQDRVQVQLDLAARKVDEEIEESDEEESDPDVCVLHIRMDGKKKIHEISLRADDQLKTLLRKLPVAVEDDEDFQITCVAKKLTIKSTDEAIMKKTFRDLGLVPKSSLVVALGSKEQVLGTFKMVDRAAKKTKKRKGSHTMQSVGIYSKDDNAKGELIDGGGGTCYEQDVTDDEEEIIDADVEQVPIEADIDSSDDSTDEEG